MKIRINRQRCAGCSLCEETIPSLFYIDGFHAAVRENYESLLNGNEILRHQLADLAGHCPLQAIYIESDESDSAEPDSVEFDQEQSAASEFPEFGEASFSAQRLNKIGKSR